MRLTTSSKYLFSKVILATSLIVGCSSSFAEIDNKPIIKTYKTETELYGATARKIADLLIKKTQAGKHTVLGLSTSKTVIPIYHALREIIKTENIDVSRLIIFNSDEFTGISPDNPQSHYYRLFSNFFEGLFWRPDNPKGMKPKNIYLPNGKAKLQQNLSAEEKIFLMKTFPKRKKGTPLDEKEEMSILLRRAEDYDLLVKNHGPIDLQILDINSNGQIGYLAPDSLVTDGSQVVKLTEKMRREYLRYFNNDITLVPQYVISIGMKNILNSKIVFLVASGKDKAPMIAKILAVPISPEIPGTALRLNSQVVFFLDEAAASDIKGEKHKP